MVPVCSSEFLRYIIKNKNGKILLAHRLPNAQHLLALLDFYSPQATGWVEMSNPALYLHLGSSSVMLTKFLIATTTLRSFHFHVKKLKKINSCSLKEKPRGPKEFFSARGKSGSQGYKRTNNKLNPHQVFKLKTYWWEECTTWQLQQPPPPPIQSFISIVLRLHGNTEKSKTRGLSGTQWFGTYMIRCKHD